MFWQGFFFALGLAAGVITFSLVLLIFGVVMDRCSRLFRKPHQMDESIDIREWQQRRSARRERREDFRPAS